jgi:ferritin-like metal-binding protein YciE
MAEITTPRELFLHELGDILYVEERLEQEVLPKLMEEATHRELRDGLEKHLRHTRQHVENVEEAFERLGEQPRSEECAGFEGLKKEHEQLAAETSPALLDLVVTGSAARTEHYEIVAYEGLIGKARALGEREVVDLLEKNLQDDKETARQVEKIGKELSKEAAKEFVQS